MAEKKTASKFLETRYFGLVIGLVVFLLLWALSSGTVLVRSLEQKLLDLNFRFKDTISSHPGAGGSFRGPGTTPGSPRIS